MGLGGSINGLVPKNEKIEFSTKIEGRCEGRDMGLGGEKHGPAVPGTDFWPPTSALPPLKKIINVLHHLGM